MRDVVKIVATLLLLGWLASTLDTDRSPAHVPSEPKWRRTVRGWRELSAWYIPNGQFHHVPLGPISFAALQSAVVVAYLVLTPSQQPARRVARPTRRRPTIAAVNSPGSQTTAPPTRGRLSAAVRPTANRRTTLSHPRSDPPTRTSGARRPRRR